MRRFLRDINNLAKFCSELSSVTQLQYNLTKGDMPFQWSTRHQKAFDSAKVLATCAACLAYFYVTVPLILQVDASDYGRGAALLQNIKLQSSSALDESSLRPIEYCKRPVTTEESYAQIEKECLAIIEALNTLEETLLGKSNRVCTDHLPFQSIFMKDLASAPECLQKMLIVLQRYNFTVVYRKGSLLNLADNLSRTPCPSEQHLARLDSNPLALTNATREQLRNATSSCPDMHLLQHYPLNGWPSAKKLLPHQLQASWHFREELTFANGILLKSTCAIVPTLSDQAC